MKQVYRPYWDWECYKNGMWNKVSKEEEQKLLKIAIDFTSDHSLYGSAMREVVYLWPCTMENHLTNKSINRRAFLGHCAVFYKFQIPEYIVRKAWRYLTDDQRKLADLEAEKTIKEWEIQYMIKLRSTSKRGSEDVTKTEYQTKLHFN